MLWYCTNAKKGVLLQLMIRIVTYEPQYRQDFIQLNKQWIETWFRLEQSDLDTFAHIDDNIIGHGGQIFLAIDESRQVVGCCALKPHPESDCHELAKMAVSPDAQGKGIGRQLGEALLDYARSHDVKRIFLEGNTRLEASIALYRKLGFKEIPLKNNAYERCDILMELCLKNKTATIRPIEQKDQKPLARVIRSVFEEYGAPLVNTVYDDSRTWHIWESLQGVNAGYWVINEDSEVMGGCGFYPTEGLPEGYVELVKFYLSPKVRGKGYGSKLFSLVINEARKAGYTHLYIESFPEFADAVKMYARHGFVKLPSRLGHSGHTATTIHMVLSL